MNVKRDVNLALSKISTEVSFNDDVMKKLLM